MASLIDNFSRVDAVLASAVANAATFDIGYPAGTTQATFQNGLATAGSIMLVNDNDRWTTANFSLSFGASLITVTNNTGATLPAGSRVSFNLQRADGNDVEVLTFPVNLVAIGGNVDVVTDYSPGMAGVIESVAWIQGTPVTTAARLATLNLEIGTTDVTGGVIALTSALATPLGKVIPGTAITANNVLTPDSKISIEATGVTAFAEGSGAVQVRIRRTYGGAYAY